MEAVFLHVLCKSLSNICEHLLQLSAPFSQVGESLFSSPARVVGQNCHAGTRQADYTTDEYTPERLSHLPPPRAAQPPLLRIGRLSNEGCGGL